MKRLLKSKSNREPEPEPGPELQVHHRIDKNRLRKSQPKDAVPFLRDTSNNRHYDPREYVQDHRESMRPYYTTPVATTNPSYHIDPLTVTTGPADRPVHRPNTWTSRTNYRSTDLDTDVQRHTFGAEPAYLAGAASSTSLPQRPNSHSYEAYTHSQHDLLCDSSCWLRKIAEYHAETVSQALISGYQSYIPNGQLHWSQSTGSDWGEPSEHPGQNKAVPSRSPSPALSERALCNFNNGHPAKPDGQYRPLATDVNPYTSLKPWQTRLIRLYQGSWNDSLRCDLMVVNMIDSPGCGIEGTSEIVCYEALSYSWARDTMGACIHVNGALRSIPIEAAKALTHLRLEDRDRYLWCDALCINQSDADEKATQIRSMLRIFEKAETTIAWLGEPHLRSFQLVKALETTVPEPSSMNSPHVIQGTACWETLARLNEALRWHLSSNWFLRTWIRQEVFAAKELTLCMGGYNLSFELFNENLDMLSKWCGFLHGPVTWPKTLDVLQQEFQHFGTDRYDALPPKQQKEFSEHWLTILSKGPLFSVTEERDRIYGSIGILSSTITKFYARLPAKLDALIRQFPVSYDPQKTLGEVFGDVTKFLINVTGTANVLDFWRIPNLERISCEGLATWAVDWRYFDGIVLPSAITCGYTYKRTGCVNQPVQDYHKESPLILKGTRLTSGFTSIVRLKLFRSPPGYEQKAGPKYSQLLDDILSSDTDPLRSVWLDKFIDCYEQHEFRLKLDQIPGLAESLKQGHYCMAWADRELTSGSTEAAFIVPRATQIDDIVVSFYGSTYQHLIRLHPSSVRNTEASYLYLGPVLEFVSSVSTDGLYKINSASHATDIPQRYFQVPEKIPKESVAAYNIQTKEFRLV